MSPGCAEKQPCRIMMSNPPTFKSDGLPRGRLRNNKPQHSFQTCYSAPGQGTSQSWDKYFPLIYLQLQRHRDVVILEDCEVFITAEMLPDFKRQNQECCRISPATADRRGKDSPLLFWSNYVSLPLSWSFHWHPAALRRVLKCSLKSDNNKIIETTVNHFLALDEAMSGFPLHLNSFFLLTRVHKHYNLGKQD